MTKPLLIMFVGVPGSGKTYFAKRLAQKLHAVTINSDAIRLSMWGSRDAIRATHATGRERVSANRLTFGAMDYAAVQIIKAGHSVVYDCNANKYEERAKMAMIAREAGGLGIVVRIQTPHAVAVRRGLEREEADDQPKFLVETAEQVVERFAKEIEEPSERENVIEISGELPFEGQYTIFEREVGKFRE